MSLGVMSVNPEFFGQGVGRRLVREIIRSAEASGHPAIRLVGSAINMDSFSLYNRAGFIPKQCYQDMVVPVPICGLGRSVPSREQVRAAGEADVAAMRVLELAVSGIVREPDYRYAIANPRGAFSAAVLEGRQGGIDGFVFSVNHPALRMIGPLVARTEDAAIALLAHALEGFRGGAALAVVPMDRRKVLDTLYHWGARNVETHLFQVRGEFQPFAGVSFPSFLPETG